MNLFELGENKLKAVTDWIANEAIDDKWFIELVYPSNTKKNQLEHSQVLKYALYAKTFISLSNLTEKLAFKDSNKDEFDFTSPVINLRKEKDLVFTFNFLPNPREPQQVEEFNRWFIKRSIGFLKSNKPSKNGLTYTTLEELKERFLYLKDRTPLLAEFIDLENQRVRTLCNKSFPNLFDTLLSYRIKAFEVNLTNRIFDQRLWPDLYVWPYVEYYIYLKLYKKNELEEQLKQSSIQGKNNEGTSGEGTQEESNSKKRDYTIQELFKSNSSKLELFIAILKSKGYLTEKGRWNNLLQPGDFLPIVNYLKEHKVIKDASSAMLWRIFEKELGPIMSERNFRITNHQFTLDESLEATLFSLTRQ